MEGEKMVTVDGKMAAAEFRAALIKNKSDKKNINNHPKELFKSEHICGLKYPSQSPDLNQYKNLWQEMKSDV